jgi:Tol biopolymer transport system component
MRNLNRACILDRTSGTFLLLLLASALVAAAQAQAQNAFRERLRALPFRIAYECYVNNNWEIFVMNADGSDPVNLTRTPNANEHYPQISPDATKICFAVDEGEGRDAVRSLWVMDIDGQHRQKLADHAREAFWSPDGKVIGFLPQEFPKFNVMDFYTSGMSFYDLATGKVEPHVNSKNLHHLYNPSWSANGKWIVATVHAGMGEGHAILLIEARGNRVINLHIPGCRPCFSPDGKQVAWGAGDHEIGVGSIDTDAEQPALSKWHVRVKDPVNETYHVDWSPDCRFLCFSRGPASKGDPSKPGTFLSACEIVGVYAAQWNLCAVSAEPQETLDLGAASEADFCMLTTNGLSNKEPAWFKPAKP